VVRKPSPEPEPYDKLLAAAGSYAALAALSSGEDDVTGSLPPLPQSAPGGRASAAKNTTRKAGTK
jgi:hypothetical protein